mgnify:CR=1 FL=1
MPGGEAAPLPPTPNPAEASSAQLAASLAPQPADQVVEPRDRGNGVWEQALSVLAASAAVTTAGGGGGSGGGSSSSSSQLVATVRRGGQVVAQVGWCARFDTHLGSRKAWVTGWVGSYTPRHRGYSSRCTGDARTRCRVLCMQRRIAGVGVRVPVHLTAAGAGSAALHASHPAQPLRCRPGRPSPQLPWRQHCGAPRLRPPPGPHSP